MELKNIFFYLVGETCDQSSFFFRVSVFECVVSVPIYYQKVVVFQTANLILIVSQDFDSAELDIADNTRINKRSLKGRLQLIIKA